MGSKYMRYRALSRKQIREQVPREDGATELRTYPKNDPIYLHRPKIGRSIHKQLSALAQLA